MTQFPSQLSPGARRLSYRTRLVAAVYLLAELAVVIALAYVIGLGLTILAALGTSVIGAVLVRAIGMKAIRQYRDAVSQQTPPGETVVSGTIGIVGAVLLCLPGFISDLIGLLCVLPPTRFVLRPLVIRLLAKHVDSPSYSRWFGPRVVQAKWGAPKPSTASADDEVIDGEVLDGDGGATDNGHENGPRSHS